MITRRGLISIEELQLGDKVQTIHNRNILMTKFLGWIHKEEDHTERFIKLKTESAQITLSKKHVIFYKPKGRKTDTMTTTFADLIEESDLLQVILNGEVHWEKVVNIDFETRKGIYAPLTAAGTILVDDVLASCYADFLFQSVVMPLCPPLRNKHKQKTSQELRNCPRLTNN